MTLLDRFADRSEFEAILAIATPEEREIIAAGLKQELFELDWEAWLQGLFPDYVTAPFASHQEDLWDWIWALERNVSPRPFVAVWPRGAAKSTTAELACVALGARKRRKYGWYVSATQELADDHVSNIGAMLESASIEEIYPELAARAVSKYGSAKGWRRNRLRTASDFTVDAIGLDTAARGVKIDEQRPDFLVLDDLDEPFDGPVQTEKKITTITRSLMPAGSQDLAVLAIQNLIVPAGVFASLCAPQPDFMTDRILSGPIPAIEGLVTEEHDGRHVITGGTPTWEGQDLAACQGFIDLFGPTAFLAECQHDVSSTPGGMFDHLVFRHVERAELPDLVRTVVWVDPAVTNTDRSDAHGVECDGIDADGTIYRLHSWEQRATPVDALRLAIRWAYQEGSQTVGVETDQGAETWESVYREALTAVQLEHPEFATLQAPRFTHWKAGSLKMQEHGIGQPSKAARAQLMLPDYETGRIVHVNGTHDLLERALRRFPRVKPYDLVDASFWSWRDLRGFGGPARSYGAQTAAATFGTAQGARGASGRGGLATLRRRGN